MHIIERWPATCLLNFENNIPSKRETTHTFGKITLYYKILELKKLKGKYQLFHNTRKLISVFYQLIWKLWNVLLYLQWSQSIIYWSLSCESQTFDRPLHQLMETIFCVDLYSLSIVALIMSYISNLPSMLSTK